MINFGTIGTSWITKSFIKAAQLSGEFNLTAVYSRSEKKAKSFIEEFNVNDVFTDIEAMAKCNDIDMVYIASPNSLHFEQALLFLKNKKHVVCEKPIFSNTKELDEAFKTADENGVFLFEATRNIHTPNFNTLKEKLGMAGQLRSAVLPYIQYSSRYDVFLQGEEPNVFSASFSGGALVDLGVYSVSLAAGLFGAPKKVSYHPVMLRSGIDGAGTLVLEYDGFVCTVICSKISHSSMSPEIHGEKGTFILEDVAPISKLEFVDNHTKESENLGVPQEEQDMVYECRDFAAIINTNNQREYEKWRNLSTTVLQITEEARKQNNIIFASEK